jgi:hypothetical protein
MASRKAVAAALLALLTASGAFPNSGRRLRKPEQAASPGRPGLYLIKPRETYRYDSADQQGVPTVRLMEFLAVLYTDVGADETAVPADLIDDLLEVIDAALKPGTFDMLQNGGRLTLGGLAYSVRISGDPEFAPGDTQGKGMTVIPIQVVLP